MQGAAWHKSAPRRLRNADLGLSAVEHGGHRICSKVISLNLPGICGVNLDQEPPAACGLRAHCHVPCFAAGPLRPTSAPKDRPSPNYKMPPASGMGGGSPGDARVSSWAWFVVILVFKKGGCMSQSIHAVLCCDRIHIPIHADAG